MCLYSFDLDISLSISYIYEYLKRRYLNDLKRRYLNDLKRKYLNVSPFMVLSIYEYYIKMASVNSIFLPVSLSDVHSFRALNYYKVM